MHVFNVHICIYVYTCIHTYITHIHTYRYVLKTDSAVYVNAYLCKYTYSYAHICMCICIHTHIYVYIHKYMHIYMHTYIIQSDMHAYIRHAYYIHTTYIIHKVHTCMLYTRMHKAYTYPHAHINLYIHTYYIHTHGSTRICIYTKTPIH